MAMGVKKDVRYGIGLWHFNCQGSEGLCFGPKSSMRIVSLSLVSEGDKLTLMSQLKNKSPQHKIIGFLVDDILHLSLRFNFISWVHAKREENRLAHHLVHLQSHEWDERLLLHSLSS